MLNNRTKFPIFLLLLISNGFGRFGCCLKRCAFKYGVSQGKLMWFIWRMDEHRLNITPLNGCFRNFNVSGFFLIKDRLNVQSCTLKLRINNRLSDRNKSQKFRIPAINNFVVTRNIFGFCLQTKRLWFTLITNELNSFTIQNCQVIVLSAWEPTDKFSHFHDCTFNPLMPGGNKKVTHT